MTYARTSEKVKRLFIIIGILCRDGGASINEVSKRTGAHRTTIHRDMWTLREIEIPLRDDGVGNYWIEEKNLISALRKIGAEK